MRDLNTVLEEWREAANTMNRKQSVTTAAYARYQTAKEEFEWAHNTFEVLTRELLQIQKARANGEAKADPSST